MPPELNDARFLIRRSPLTHRRLARVFWQQVILPRRLEKDGVQLLHAPSYVAPLSARTPIVLTIHDVIALKYPYLCTAANVMHYKRVLPRSAEKASVIIASSSTTRDDIVSLLGVSPEKIRVVYPGVDPEFRRVEDPTTLSAVRGAYKLPEQFILFVGNIEPKKGLDTLVNAFAEMAHPHGLVLVGAPQRCAGPLREQIRRLGLTDRIVFTGHVPRNHLPVIYSLADLFVMPSIYEGFGLPVLEAMACGTPVVCSAGGALLEVAGDAAVTMPVQDANSLREAMATALADEALHQRLVANGLKRAAAFPWKEAISKLLSIYREAADGGRIHAP